MFRKSLRSGKKGCGKSNAPERSFGTRRGWPAQAFGKQPAFGHSSTHPKCTHCHCVGGNDLCGDWEFDGGRGQGSGGGQDCSLCRIYHVGGFDDHGVETHALAIRADYGGGDECGLGIDPADLWQNHRLVGGFCDELHGRGGRGSGWYDWKILMVVPSNRGGECADSKSDNRVCRWAGDFSAGRCQR